ncbi:hypothetical protein SAMD00019534_095960, partial [Acytostelium subglobosum LB1]|uniref:hypothetical protein n=1 Tax=Acytostelium subglobosum LB1 TaxID=1410327 RepID=UPI0006451A27
MNLFLLSLILIVGYLIIDWIGKNRRIHKNEPPGPRALPLIGNLHQIGPLPHIGFTEMTKKYGHVFRVWLGDNYHVIVDDPEVIKEITVRNFDNFTNRLLSPSFEVMSRGYINLAVGRDDHWYHLRKLVSNAFTKTKIRTVGFVIEEHIDHLIRRMKLFEKDNQPFYPRFHLKKYAVNIIFSMVFSDEIPYDEDVHEGRMQSLFVPIDKVMRHLGSGKLADCVNILKPLLKFKQRTFGTDMDIVFKITAEIYDEHVATLDENNPRDLFDSLIIDSKGKHRDSVIMVGTDFIISGTETSASTIEMFMMYMINNQEVQEKVASELASIVGVGNRVSMSHRPKCPYTIAVIHEVMRMMPVAALVPRMAKESIMLADKYFIAKGTHMLINYRSWNHREDLWELPEQFLPERFLGQSTDFQPFSSGPRNCVGQNLAVEEVFVGCANIIHNFRLSSVDGKPVAEEETFGLTICPKEFQVSVQSRT